MEEDVRLIKKYPNRRLYDTVTSRYITLDDVKALVKTGVPIQVLHAKTGEDLTRGCLVQIILEQDDSGHPLFSLQALEQFIRMAQHPMQAQWTTLFNQAIDGMLKQLDTRELGKQTESVLQQWGLWWQQNMQIWQNVVGPSKPPATEN